MSDFRMRIDKPMNKLNRPVISMGGILPVDKSTPPVKAPEVVEPRKDLVLALAPAQPEPTVVVEPEPKLVTKLPVPKKKVVEQEN